MKKILLFGTIAVILMLCQCGKDQSKSPFVGSYSVEMDLSYLDTSSPYADMYFLLAAMVDSANSGELIPYQISIDDTSLTSYYSNDEKFSYSYTYHKVNNNYYQLTLDKKDTIDLEIQGSNIAMIFPDDMAFLLHKK